MPSISLHQSASFTKILFIGDSGTGKTGALASLAAAGYKLRILDLDNGLDILKNYATHPTSPYVKQNPKIAENIHFVTLTEKMKNLNGRLIPTTAKVWPDALSLLDNWKEYELDDAGKRKMVDGKPVVALDLGKPSEWGADCILVVDSLTFLSTAAYNYHCSLNARLGQQAEGNQWRRDVGATQGMLEGLLTLLCAKEFQCNVIVNSHISFVNDETPDVPGADVGKTGYPAAIGKALSPKIPRWFNTALLAKTVGVGATAKHKIFTVSQGIVELKSSNPLAVAKDYPLETGLADYFKAVRG